MATRSKTNGPKPNSSDRATALPDDFPSDLRGEFDGLPTNVCTAYGIVAGLALAGGGYIGLSTTDDGSSCKLAVRAARLSFEKRVISIAQLEKLLVYCKNKLTD